MRLVRGLEALPPDLRFAVTIGMFDGVHRGHVRALRTLVATARRLRAASVVVTFDPHPAEVLHGGAPSLLCSPAERIARIAAVGVDWLVVQPFDRSFAAQSAQDFLRRVAATRQLVAVVMTSESAFGRNRTGMLPEVAAVGQEMGFEVAEIPVVGAKDGTVSSSRVRELLASGRLAEVKRLLGRPYALTGTVVRGDRRGRELGFPTANLNFEKPVALPPDGIYAVRAGWGGRDPLRLKQTADGVASLGVRPTFGGGARTFEVYLFDFDGDLYGKTLRVELVRRLRGEKKFATAKALIGQMERDAANARAVLKRASHPRQNRTTVRLGRN